MGADRETPGERIRRIREDRGYTRDYVSEKAGISSKFLFEVETNRTGFSAHTLMRLSDALGANMDYIMTGQIPFRCEDEIAVTLERFSPGTLEPVARLLEVAYEIASCSTSTKYY